MTELCTTPDISAASFDSLARFQALAARLSNSFSTSLSHAARALKVQLPTGLFIDAAVEPGAGDSLHGRMHVSMPGLDRSAAREVLHAAHQTCPYWRLSPKNIDVVITLL